MSGLSLLVQNPSLYWSVPDVRPVSPCPNPRLYIGVWLVSGLSLLVQPPYVYWSVAGVRPSLLAQNPSVYWSVAGVRPVSPCPNPLCILECGWCQACLSLSKPRLYIGVWLVSGLSLLVQNPSVYWSVAGVRPVSPCPNPVCILECGWCQACLSLSKTRLYIGVWLVSGLSLLVQTPYVYWSVAGVRPVSPCPTPYVYWSVAGVRPVSLSPKPVCILECGWWLSLLVQNLSVYWSVAGVRPVSPCPTPYVYWSVAGVRPSLLVQNPSVYWSVAGVRPVSHCPNPVCILECGWYQACLSLSKTRLYIGVWLVSGLSLLVQTPSVYWSVAGIRPVSPCPNPSVYWSVAGVRPVSPCPNPVCILECGWYQACLSLSKTRLYIGVWLVSGLSLLVQNPSVYWSVAGVRPVSLSPKPVCILECGWCQACLSLSKPPMYIGVWLVSGLSLLVQPPSVYWSVAGVRPVFLSPKPVCILECGWWLSLLVQNLSVYWSVAGVRPVSLCPKAICILGCGWCQACLFVAVALGPVFNCSGVPLYI